MSECKETVLEMAKVIQLGDTQAVQLPKQFRLSAEEVEVFRRGDEIALRETPETLASVIKLLRDLSDFDQDDTPPQEREGL